MLLSDVCLSDVCRVHREYSWRPQLLEARRAGCRRPCVKRVWAGAGPQRAARTGAGRGHIVAASRLQLVRIYIPVSFACFNLAFVLQDFTKR